MTAPFNALLIANRGEIAIRIARACADLGIRSVAVFAEDDAASLHVRKADVALPLAGRGVAAYLDMDRLVALALEQGCEAIHPGYGFLAENGEFARRCQRAGIHFVGPQAEVLDLFGDKAAARPGRAPGGAAGGRDQPCGQRRRGRGVPGRAGRWRRGDAQGPCRRRRTWHARSGGGRATGRCLPPLPCRGAGGVRPG
ncbi:Carbamoyl-phosphate synthase L chain protein [Pseudomonas aeruginosa]|nr:Carbamoyl-phosphate synthase L chain protein [Pseudomonas aeruginosa]